MTAPHADLVIVRHGESLGNAEGFLAGWRDVDLTERGCEQARTAGRLLRPLAIPFAAVFTSLLRRATRTADLLLRELGTQPPRHERWRLNERHYGALQGLGKDVAKERYGKDLARTFRSSWDTAPPPAPAGSSDDPRSDARFRDATDALPNGESLAALVARTAPLWDELRPRLLAGESLLLIAHNQSLRALLHTIEGSAEPRLPGSNLGNGAPRRYRLDREGKIVAIERFGDETGPEESGG